MNNIHLRRSLKFLHTMGAAGMIGAMCALAAMLMSAPATSKLAEYTQLRGAMGAIATWVFLPALALTLIAGLLSIAFNRGYHNAGWAWAKLATGILIFEGSFVGVIGPMQQEAEDSAAALGGKADLVAGLGAALSAEQNTLWLMLAVSTANVALGVWRPKFTNLPD